MKAVALCRPGLVTLLLFYTYVFSACYTLHRLDLPLFHFHLCPLSPGQSLHGLPLPIYLNLDCSLLLQTRPLPFRSPYLLSPYVDIFTGLFLSALSPFLFTPVPPHLMQTRPLPLLFYTCVGSIFCSLRKQSRPIPFHFHLCSLPCSD